MLWVLWLNLALACSMASAAHAADSSARGIVTYILQNQSGNVGPDVPVTFGAVFADGDVPAGAAIIAVDSDGKRIPLQADVKAHNPDGSLRHAVLTLDVPRLPSNADFPVTIMRGDAAGGPPISLSALPQDFDTNVELAVGGEHLRVSARELLANTKPELWLSGPLVTEWWVSGPFRGATGKPDPHLSVRFGIRSHGKGRPLRIEVDVENDWTWVPQPMTKFYDAAIRMNGKTVFAKTGMVQPAQTRWRKVFWWNAPADVFVKQDIAYLKKTRIIPNYNPDARVSGANVDELYRAFEKNDREPMGNGIITAYMPTTGGRPDIGPLPAWTVYYLLTMDPRAAEMTMTSADLGGSFPSHYRNIRTGRPTTTEEYPKISTHSNLVGKPGNLELPDTGGHEDRLVPEAPHEPSLDFIPYVVTGERYYLEELEFWSQWNSWGTAPGYHGFERSLVGWDQIRGQAWSLRTLAQAAYITPDTDPLKGTLLRELKANADWYNASYVNNPDADVFHAANPPDHRRGAAPWQDDFLTWAAQYAVQLGFKEWELFAKWKAFFPVQRMINPHYCWILATDYGMRVENDDGSFIDSWAKAYQINFTKDTKKKTIDPGNVLCGSQEMADALGLKAAGEMLGGARSGEGYPSNLQPALAVAVDAGVPGAEQAWNKLQARPVKPKDGIDASWDILPWSGK